MFLKRAKALLNRLTGGKPEASLGSLLSGSALLKREPSRHASPPVTIGAQRELPVLARLIVGKFAVRCACGRQYDTLFREKQVVPREVMCYVVRCVPCDYEVEIPAIAMEKDLQKYLLELARRGKVAYTFRQIEGDDRPGMPMPSSGEAISK